MRTLSNPLLAQLYGANSNDPFLILLTLTHASFASTVYLVNNNEDVVSNGNTFIAFPMDITIPADDGRTEKNAQIVFDNVSLELIDEIRSVTSPIEVQIQMVLASDPDTVEIEISELKMGNVSYNASTITADLYLDDFLNTDLSNEKYTPTIYPGLFT